MAINRLNLKGIMPTFDTYKRPITEIEKEFEDIIQANFNGSLKVEITRDTGVDNGAYMNVNITTDVDDIDEDLIDQMMDAGMDIEDPDDVQNYLLFELGGGQDTWMTWGGEVVDDTTGGVTDHVYIHINPRQDVTRKVLEVMDTANEGTREETLGALNRLLKYVKKVS